MTSVTIQLPDGVLQQLRECADREGITLDQLLSSAAAEKLSAMVTVAELRARGQRSNPSDFTRFLDAAPDVPPLAGDER